MTYYVVTQPPKGKLPKGKKYASSPHKTKASAIKFGKRMMKTDKGMTRFIITRKLKNKYSFKGRK